MIDTMARTAREETKLPLAVIRTDGGTQPRDGLIEEEVDEYVFQLRHKAQFPPIEVVYDGSDYYVWDGFHRLEAHKRAKKTEIAARVQPGTREDAVWLSYRANITHGIRRSPADRQRAVMGALQHPRSSGMTDKHLAAHCGVAVSTISQWRKRLIEEGTLPDPHARQPAEEGASGNGEPGAGSGENDELAAADAVQRDPAPQSPENGAVDTDDGRDALPADAPPEAAPSPTLPADLGDLGWTLTQDEARHWQGQHDDLGVQTDPHADPAAAIAEIRDLARALGAEMGEGAPASGGDATRVSGLSGIGSEAAERQIPNPEPQSPNPDPLPPSADRERAALRVNLLGLLYQLADEHWQQLAPGEDAWQAVAFDYDALHATAQQILDAPLLQDALERLRAPTT